MGLTPFEIEKKIKRLQEQLRCISCKNCVEVEGCADGQVPVWDEEIQMWVCGDAAGGHDPVTLNADTPTQDSANLVGQELQLVPATNTTYGVVKLEDIIIHDEVTLNADVPTQDSLNLVGQEIQVNPATNTEYGVVKLGDIPNVTLNADQPTQDAANLVGQELQLIAAGPTTYGVVKLEDLFDTSDHVNTYADLPDPTLHQDETWIVLNSTGTKYWNWLVGGTWKPKGFYYSNGVSWDWIGDVPYQASQADVDAGVIVDQFVSPATLAAATSVIHTDTNFGNTNITYTGDRTHDAAGFGTTINNADSFAIYNTGVGSTIILGNTAVDNVSVVVNDQSLVHQYIDSGFNNLAKITLDVNGITLAQEDGKFKFDITGGNDIPPLDNASNKLLSVDSTTGIISTSDKVTQYTDELAQDAIGLNLVDSSTIDFTYDDGLGTITAIVKTGSIGPTELAATTVVAGSYTNTNLTVDADGRITTASNGSSSFDYTQVLFAQVFS